MRKFLTIMAAMLAFAVSSAALAQNHGDRGGWSRGHDAPRGHDRDYRSARHGVPFYGNDRGYRSNDRDYRGNDHRYERRDRYERRYQKRRMHHHHRGRHWRG